MQLSFGQHGMPVIGWSSADIISSEVSFKSHPGRGQLNVVAFAAECSVLRFSASRMRSTSLSLKRIASLAIS